jgi:Phage integrase family/Phage integrase, N-terminal SAM-like domain
LTCANSPPGAGPRSLSLVAVRRADIEGFARELEARGRARATVTRRLSTIAGFYRYAVEEELLEHSPAAHVSRPRVDYESHAVALDRNELGGLLVAAGLGPPAEHALISLLALNGLRVSEATGADIEHLGLERGHRTLTITRKGGKVVTIPLAPRTARAIDLAIGERAGGPVFLAADGQRLDRHGAGRIVRKTTRRAGIAKSVTPIRSGTPSSPPRSMPGSPCAMCKRPPRTPIREPRCGTTGPAAAWTGTPRTSSPHISRVPPGSPRRLCAPPGGMAARRSWRTVRFRRPKPRASAVTDRDPSANANRRSARFRVPSATAISAGQNRLIWRCHVSRRFAGRIDRVDEGEACGLAANCSAGMARELPVIT